MSRKQNTLKVMTIFGTRPEIIRLSRVFAELDAYVAHVMVHTGQSYDYEMSQVFFDDLKIGANKFERKDRGGSAGGRIFHEQGVAGSAGDQKTDTYYVAHRFYTVNYDLHGICG